MKPQGPFFAQRAVARHCAQLLPPQKPPIDLVDAGRDLGRMIAREAIHCLAPAVGGGNLKVACENPGKTSTTAYLNRLGKNYAHSVIDLGGIASLVISIEIADALALTDRAYGGDGEIPEILPDELPLSADLALVQIELAAMEAIVSAFAPILGEGETKIARRGRDMGKLDPFRGKPECVDFTLRIDEAEREPWRICIAMGLNDVYKLTELSAEALSEPAPERPANDPTAAPFCDIMFPAKAVLAEMPISLSKLASLSEGDVIPLAIARQVPLKIDGLTIAHGLVGAKDDCLALQILPQIPGE